MPVDKHNTTLDSEQLSPVMIGTSTAEYLFIRGCIAGLTTWPILCVLYCAALATSRILQSPIHRFSRPVEALAVAEAAFFLFFFPFRAHLKREAVHPPPPSREERRELYRRCNANIADPESYIQTWFLGASLEEIKKDNVKEFLLWAFFNRGGEPGEDDEELEEYLGEMEKLLGREFPNGMGTAKCLRLTIDDPNMLHRSLIWYAVSTSWFTQHLDPFPFVSEDLHSNLIAVYRIRRFPDLHDSQSAWLSTLPYQCAFAI